MDVMNRRRAMHQLRNPASVQFNSFHLHMRPYRKQNVSDGDSNELNIIAFLESDAAI